MVSNTITVQEQDQFQNPTTTAETVLLSTSNASTGLFKDNATGQTTIAQVMIAAGSSTASFKYTDTLASTPTLTAAASGLTSATQTETVKAGTATQLSVSAPLSAEAGSAVVVTVAAQDAFHNTATSYTGTVQISSSDSKAVLPASATLSNGVGSFSVIFQTTASQKVTVKASIGQATVSVSVFAGTPVQKGQAAGIGFWQSQNGQALINSFNGGSTSTALASWLATTFSNLYGTKTGAHNLTGMKNYQVAAFYINLFNTSATKLDAEVLATALNLYATTSSLGGTAATQYGFTVTASGLGVATYNVGSNGAAFGVPSATTLTVMQILLQASAQTVQGVLYNGSSSLDQLALLVFDGINTAGGI
jgi:hypothetical protein